MADVRWVVEVRTVRRRNRRLRAIVFDMDGVLFEGENFWLDLHREYGTEREAIELARRYLSSAYARLARITAEEVWRGRPAEPYLRLVEERRCHPGVAALFAWLRAADTPLPWAIRTPTWMSPAAAGVDVLGDRWTPLVIRELMVGASGFNEIHRGIPRMSRTLLAQRLRLLERRGLVHRDVGERGRPGRYGLTAAGEALTPIVRAIRIWAAEWVFGDPTDEDCDGLLLIWRMHQFVIPAKLPEQRVVVYLVLTGPGAAQGWLCAERRAITVCKDDPGYDVDLAIEADTGHMQRWFVGLVPYRDLVSNGHVRALGPSRLARAFPTWFDTSVFAEGLRRGEQRRVREAVPA